MAVPVLVVRDLWKSYDGHTDVLQGVSLEAGPGECVLVWGENGSGKTTLLSLLGGLDAPDRGKVTVNGQEVTGLNENALSRVRLLQIGFVFQAHHLIEDLTVEDNLALPLRLAKRPADARVRELLHAFGLTKFASRKPSAISVGESQRVAVARALANGPKILLADEPTAALDAKGTTAVLEALRLARTRFGTAEVVATHDPAVQAIATSQYVLQQGALRPRA
jgi:ABC-type lipoprotein export system ATPase subunit